MVTRILRTRLSPVIAAILGISLFCCRASLAADVNVIHGINGRDLGASTSVLPVSVSVNQTCVLKGVTFKSMNLLEVEPGSYTVRVFSGSECSQSPVVERVITVGLQEDGDSFSLVASLTEAGMPQLAWFKNTGELFRSSLEVRHLAKAGEVVARIETPTGSRRPARIWLGRFFNGEAVGFQSASPMSLGTLVLNSAYRRSGVKLTRQPAGVRQIVYIVGSADRGLETISETIEDPAVFCTPTPAPACGLATPLPGCGVTAPTSTPSPTPTRTATPTPTPTPTATPVITSTPVPPQTSALSVRYVACPTTHNAGGALRYKQVGAFDCVTGQWSWKDDLNSMSQSCYRIEAGQSVCSLESSDDSCQARYQSGNDAAESCFPNRSTSTWSVSNCRAKKVGGSQTTSCSAKSVNGEWRLRLKNFGNGCGPDEDCAKYRLTATFTRRVCVAAAVRRYFPE